MFNGVSKLTNNLNQCVERIALDQLVLWFKENPNRRIVSLNIDTYNSPVSYLMVSEVVNSSKEDVKVEKK